MTRFLSMVLLLMGLSAIAAAQPASARDGHRPGAVFRD